MELKVGVGSPSISMNLPTILNILDILEEYDFYVHHGNINNHVTNVNIKRTVTNISTTCHSMTSLIYM